MHSINKQKILYITTHHYETSIKCLLEKFRKPNKNSAFDTRLSGEVLRLHKPHSHSCLSSIHSLQVIADEADSTKVLLLGN